MDGEQAAGQLTRLLVDALIVVALLQQGDQRRVGVGDLAGALSRCSPLAVTNRLQPLDERAVRLLQLPSGVEVELPPKVARS